MSRHGKYNNGILSVVVAMLLCMALGACSTTSRIGEGETLYTGVKKLNYVFPDTVEVEDGVKDQIFEAINVKPNNPLYSPYYRTPLPIGLWVYNHWNEKSKGIKGWFYKKLVAYPVLISRVRPETRVDMIKTLLEDNGYFGSSASYKLNYSSEQKRKASVSYEVKVKKPYLIDSVIYTGIATPIGRFIDSVARADRYLKPGSRYCLDSLNNVRINITNALRNNGYYYFRPEYIEYLADSTAHKGSIAVKIAKASNVPNMALVKYMVNNVVATVSGNHGGGTPDTLQFRNCTLVKMVPVHISDNTIPDCIRSRKGRPFRVGNMDRTQMYLSQLGIFSNINMRVLPVDSTTAEGNGLVDLHIDCTLDKPYEVKFEAQGTSKSNSFIGPSLGVGLEHKNLFGAGEQLSAKLNASYEWQTGNGGRKSNRDINSYEFGAEVTLAIPRLLAPKFIDRNRRYRNWTRFSLNGDIMNRPGFFKMYQVGTKFTWEWHASKKSLIEYTPFMLTYSKLLSTTHAFDSAMTANPAIALSFRNTFIPKMQYSYTYDTPLGMKDNLTWTSTVAEAGNIFAGVWELAGSKHTKRLFGTPFSQFVKAQTQVVWNHTLTGEHRIVGRVFVGAAHAYGNSSQVPYSEQFYIGGANSVRAFTVRTIGPGKYHAAQHNANAYYDQTGTFKFETNWEYRFPLLGYFKGALFVDAGNVWLLKNDEYRPGGKLEMKNFFDELALGTGAGIRFDMDMLVIRADLGIGIHAPYDTGKRGYYNLPRFKDGLAFHLAIGYPF